MGLLELDPADLVYSDDFATRLALPRVRELADSIDALINIHLPMVRMSDMQVVAGEDRLAAHIILKRSTVLCDVVECSDEEVLLIRSAENERRRKEGADEIANRVAEVERAMAAESYAYETMEDTEPDPAIAAIDSLTPDALFHMPSDSATFERESAFGLPADFVPAEQRTEPEPVKRGRGRPKGSKKAHALAVEAVAAEVGRTAEAVRKVEERIRIKKECAVLEDWGTTQPPEFLDPLLEARVAFTDAAAKVQAAMACLTRLGTASALRDGVLATSQESLRALAYQLRARRPAAVCAWCKNLSSMVGPCKACNGLG